MLRHLLRITLSAAVAYVAATIAVAIAAMIELGPRLSLEGVIELMAVSLFVSVYLLPSILLFLILRIWRSCRWCSHIGFILLFLVLEMLVVHSATTSNEYQELIWLAGRALAVGAVAAYLVAWAVDRKFPEPIAPGQCRRCGYDLRAHTPGQLCPECGTLVPADIQRREIA